MKKKILKNNQAQSVVEYVILSSLVGIFCLIAIKQFGTHIQKRIKHMNHKLIEHVSIQ